MLPGTILIIGPLPAHMRATESRLVDALPRPRPRLVRDALGAAIGALACTAVGLGLVALLS
jgi:hypothetical protein